MMITIQSSEYRDGWLAGKNGLAESNVPYDSKTQGFSHNAWLRGLRDWQAAREQKGPHVVEVLDNMLTNSGSF